MRRASYRAGVEFIAMNDDPDNMDLGDIRASLTVGLLAELFGVDTDRAAQDVANLRWKNRQRE